MAGEQVRFLPHADLLSVPLGENARNAASPTVQAGQRLEPGDLIGRADVAGVLHVHAPARGRVVGLGRVDTARCAGVPAVQIEVAPEQPKDGPSELRSSESPPPRDPSNSVPFELEEAAVAAERAGLPSFGSPAVPLAELLREAAGRATHLLVNALPGEPVAGEWRPDEPAALVRITDRIGRALGARRVIIAADVAERRSYRRLRAAARKTSVQVVGLLNKYPQHTAVLLVHSILGIEAPPGRSPLEAGVLVLEGEAILNLAAALEASSGPPRALTHRLVTVAGPSIVAPGRYYIAIGTSFAHILDRVGFRQTPKRVIEGGPLTGIAVSHLDVVTTKQTSGLLVLDRVHDRIPNPGPCIRCGWCQEDCPVGLDPHILLNYAEKGDAKGAAPYHPQACIGCGVCSYVCPAELPLATAAVRLNRMQEAAEAGR